MEQPPLRIGDKLVAAGLVTEAQVAQALERQKQTGRKLGEELVELGFVTEVQLTQILSNQLAVPWVSLYRVQFSRELLNMLPAMVADRYCVIPVYIRKVRREGDTLFVAMDDPTSTEALEQVRSHTGLPVKAMVAPPSEIREAIRVYYFGGRPPPEARSAEKPAPPAPPAEAKARDRGQGGTAHDEPTGRATDASRRSGNPRGRGGDAPRARAPASKAKGKGKGPRMVTLTLLDGTEVRLPARDKKEAGGDAEAPAEQEAGSLTASDLVSALLARGEGADVSDLLPEDTRWETMFATLLQLLLRKGLIADWEFVEEWRKRQG